MSELSDEEFITLSGKAAKIHVDGDYPSLGFCLDIEGVGRVYIEAYTSYDSAGMEFNLEPEITPEIKTRNEIAESVRAEPESEKPDCQEYKDSIMR